MRKEKKFSGIIILITLVVVSVGVTGYIIWQRSDRSKKDISLTGNRDEEEPVEEKVIPVPDKTPVANPEIKPVAKPTTTTQTIEPKATGKENFEITQWNVKGYYSGGYRISYEVDKAGNLEFKSDDLGPNAADFSVASIKRRTGDQSVSTIFDFADDQSKNMTIDEYLAETDRSLVKINFLHIGKYYYYLIPPQACCLTSDIFHAIKEYFFTLVEI